MDKQREEREMKTTMDDGWGDLADLTQPEGLPVGTEGNPYIVLTYSDAQIATMQYGRPMVCRFVCAKPGQSLFRVDGDGRIDILCDGTWRATY